MNQSVASDIQNLGQRMERLFGEIPQLTVAQQDHPQALREAVERFSQQIEQFEKLQRELATLCERIRQQTTNAIDFAQLGSLVDQGHHKQSELDRARQRLLDEWKEWVSGYAEQALVTTRIPLAGVMKEQRERVARRLMAGEPLRIRSERDNPFDPMAIQLFTLSGDAVGYLPRSDNNRQLLEWIEEGDRVATVSELRVVDDLISVIVAIDLPASISRSMTASNIVITWDERKGRHYLLVDADPTQYQQILDHLDASGTTVTRSGPSVKPAANGRQYGWYIEIEESDQRERERISSRVIHHFADTIAPEYREVIELRDQTSQLVQQREETLDLAASVEQKRIHDTQQLRNEIERLNGLLTSSAHGSDSLLHERLARLLTDVVRIEITPVLVLQIILHLWPDRIKALKPAIKSAEESSFQHGHQLLALMIDFSTTYYEALTEGLPELDAAKCLGHHHSAKESESILNNQKARKARTFNWKGQRTVMERHLKIGVKPNRSETIRIHYLWDSEEKQLVIGHFGEHLYIP